MGREIYIAVPRTKLHGDPDELDAVECPNCGQVFRACTPDDMKAALRGAAH